MDIPYIVTTQAVTAHLQDGPVTIHKSENSRTYENAVDAIRANNTEALIEALSPARKVVSAFTSIAGHSVEIQGNQLTLDGQIMDDYTAYKALEIAEQGLDVHSILNFMARCANNPSYRAVKELYQFLEYGHMPLTPDGCFLAYKRVRANYMDCHSGKMDNSVGRTVSMPRNQVDDNSENTCSYGLHFCSFEYLNHFWGERIVVLKIDPADVVSIPKDYNDTKGRCAKYTVVGEQAVPERWASPVVYDYDPDWIDDPEEGEDEEYISPDLQERGLAHLPRNAYPFVRDGWRFFYSDRTETYCAFEPGVTYFVDGDEAYWHPRLEDLIEEMEVEGA